MRAGKSDLQTHSRSSAIMPFHSPYMIVYLSSTILHRFRDIIAYYLKFKDVTLPWPHPFKGDFVTPMLNRHLANQCRKFEVSSFSRSRDIVNKSHDHYHDPLGVIFPSFVKTSHSSPVTKFDSSRLSHSWDMEGGVQNLQWFTWCNDTPFRDGLQSVCWD